MKRAISIRVDANSQVGYGHALRCLALAEEGVRRGHTVNFILAPNCPQHIQKQINRIAPTVLLPSGTAVGSKMDSDFVIATVRQNKSAIIVLDGYHFESIYQKNLSVMMNQIQCLPFA